jgi:protoporphyrinogen oxidase
VSADTIILGAGPAGLGAALALGGRAIVLERESEPAGLCRTVILDGAYFDLGGHSFHTPHPAVRELVFDSLAMEEQRRDAWCWIEGEWVPYPFQKHFGTLTNGAMRAACAAGLEAAGNWQSAPDYDAYLVRRFGAGIAEHFMRPYNRKLWDGDLRRMAADWTSERVAAPQGTEEHFVEQGGRRTPLQSDTKIAYPARGGFGEIYRALAARVADLRLGQSVCRIDPVGRLIETAAGDVVRWRRIVSTLPLPLLLKLLPDVPPAISALCKTLEAVPIAVVMVVMEGQLATTRQRVYCPDPQMPGHKIVLNHTSSNWLRALPRHGIEVEVAGTMNSNDPELGRRVVGDLLRIGLIGAADRVQRIEVRRLAYGYPVPTHSRTAAINSARAWLAQHDIHLGGRFAEWAYINSDEALHRGLCLGEDLARAP